MGVKLGSGAKNEHALRLFKNRVSKGISVQNMDGRMME
jgi:hypothetical protein